MTKYNLHKETTCINYDFKMGIRLGLAIASNAVPSKREIRKTLEKINNRLNWGPSKELPASPHDAPEVTKSLFFPLKEKTSHLATSHSSLKELETTLKSESKKEVFHVQLEDVAKAVLKEKQQRR